MPRSDLDPRRSLEQQLIWAEWRGTNGQTLNEPANAKLAQEILDLRSKLAVLCENNTPKHPKNS